MTATWTGSGPPTTTATRCINETIKIIASFIDSDGFSQGGHANE